MNEFYNIPFIPLDEAECRFFDSLTADDREFYTPYFASLRKPTRVWLAIALLRFRYTGGQVLPEQNRNPFVQSIVEVFIQHESQRMDDEYKVPTVTDSMGSHPFTFPRRIADWFTFS